MDLNWDAIGALGEILGALAVVGSLIYLAASMRQNAASVKSTAALEIQRDVRSILYGDVETNEIIRRSISGEELAYSEQMLLIQRYMVMLRTFESIWFQSEQGTLESVLLEGYMHHLRVVLNAPLAMAIWKDYQEGVFHPDFVDFVAAYLDRNPPIPPSQVRPEIRGAS